MPRFKEMERLKRSLIRAMWSEGRRRARKRESRQRRALELIRHPRRRNAGIGRRRRAASAAKSTRLNTAVTKYFAARKPELAVATGTNETLEADAIILATPAFQTAKILASAAPDLANELSKISYA